MSLTRCLPTLALLALFVPGIALADPKDDARRHFTEGLAAAQSKDYEVALQHFLAAQEAYPHPATLYNIARTYQDLNDLQNALTYYRLFHDADPAHAADVEPVIAVLEARLNQSSAPTRPVEQAPVQGGVGVNPEVLQRLQTLAAEMQAKVDEVNALTEAIASGQAANTPPETPPDVPPDTPPETVPTLPEGGFLTDAYERVVVTASRYGQEPLDSPSAVTILTDEDIRLSGCTNIADVLRRAVGVEAMSLSSGQTELSVRGFNRELNNKVLILVDGKSTQWDFLGTTAWVSIPIAIEDIERVEIIRGPGSAVYGANAVTGVVNIITKPPGEGGNVVRADVGTKGYAHGTLSTTGRLGTTAYRLSAGYDQTGRWANEVDPDSGAYVSPVDFTPLSYQQYRATARLDRTFGKKGFASLSGAFAKYTGEFYNIGALGDYFIQSTSGHVRGDVAYGDVHLRVYYTHEKGASGAWAEPANWLRTLYSPLDFTVLDAELEGTKQFTTGKVEHKLNLGVGWRYRHTELDYYIPGAVNENLQSAFIQEQATVGKFNVVGSLRLDRHPLIPIGKLLSPRAAAIWRVFDKTSLRVTGGTAFRAPNTLENYMEWVLPGPADLVYVKDYGSRDLSPERIYTAEIGVHDESTSYHTADVGVYVNSFRNIIYLKDLEPSYLPGGDGPDLAYDKGYLAGSTGWINLQERYLGVGAEAEGELYPVDGVDIYANTAIERVLVSPGEGEPYAPDKSTSLVKVNAGATYRTPFRTDLALHMNYASPQTWGQREFDDNGQLQLVYADIPAQFIVSGRIGVRPLDDDSLELAVGAWNIPAMLSNDDDPDTLFGPAREHPKGQPVGGKVFGSVTYKF